MSYYQKKKWLLSEHKIITKNPFSNNYIMQKSNWINNIFFSYSKYNCTNKQETKILPNYFWFWQHLDHPVQESFHKFLKHVDNIAQLLHIFLGSDTIKQDYLTVLQHLDDLYPRPEKKLKNENFRQRNPIIYVWYIDFI